MRHKRKLSFALALVMMFSVVFSAPMTGYAADANTMKLTVLGTSDVHGTITSWGYESNKDTEDRGLTHVKTYVDSVKKTNPNTLLIDNGDTIQGTILTDDLYNKDLAVKNPVIEVMNYIGYDSMTLGNHEFNFGLPTVNKIMKEAKFPILSANIYNKKDGSNFAKPYTVKTVNGVKVGILGLSVPTIKTWDAGKVTSLEFKHMAEEAKKYVKILKEQEKVDVIIASVHAGLDSGTEADNGDKARLVAEQNPEITAMLIGHDHAAVNTTVNGVLIAAPTTAAVDMVQFDLDLEKVNGKWTVKNKVAQLVDLKKLPADKGTQQVADASHQRTMKFLSNVIGKTTGEFAPDSEVPGIPTAQIQDTAVIDLINTVQTYYTNSMVSAAALFKSDSNLPYGDLNYANIFDIYKYPNTLVGVEVTGAQLKKYMEWSAAYYNTYTPGDLTISFNEKIRIYNYDMFSGCTYKIDISKPAGQRIVDLKIGGEPVKDDKIIRLAINNYRFDNLKAMGILSNDNKVYFNSDPTALRSYIKDYISKNKVINPAVDNNWSITGAKLDHPLREAAILLVKTGKITIPKSADGRTDNVKALNINDLQAQGLLPKAYVVKEGDTLASVATMYNTTAERLMSVNKIAKAADFKAGLSVYPPTEYLFPNLKKVDILSVNDFHGNLALDGSNPGAAKLAAYMEFYKNQNPKGTVIVNAGDAFQGTPMSNLLFGAPVVEMMNTIGFDSMTVGNHEFDWGIEKVLETMKAAKFPMIAANIYKDGKPVSWAQPTQMIEKDGLKIGIIGLATVETAEAAHKNFVGMLEFKDAAPIAQKYVDELKAKGADIVFINSHLPAVKNADNSYTGELFDAAYKVNGASAFVGGHSHMIATSVVNDKAVVEANYNGRNFGHITLYYDPATKKVVHQSVEVVEVSKGTLDVQPNAAMTKLVADQKTKLDPIFGVVIGKTAKGIVRDYNAESAMGNFTTDAMKTTAKTQIAFTNAGGLRADIAAGDITVEHIFKVSPFDNTITTGEMTGKQIKAILEQSVTLSKGMLQVSGLKFTYDSAKPVGSRILSVTVDGKALEDGKKYTVATNDFLATGGDLFVTFKEVKWTNTYILVRDAMMDAVKANKGAVDPVIDGRMTDVSKKVSVIEDFFRLFAA